MRASWQVQKEKEKKNPWFSIQIDGDDVEKMIPQGETLNPSNCEIP